MKNLSFTIEKNLHEECGVVAVENHPEAANLCYLGLYALQHRGQEACGISSLENKSPENGHSISHTHKAFGLVGDAFDAEVLKKLIGHRAIGHNRYATIGGHSMHNIQPFSFMRDHQFVAIAHNGQITNAHMLREKLEARGSIFQSSSDSEIFLHLIAMSQKTSLKEKLIDAATQLDGAYCFVVLSEDGVFALRDPQGFRPLVLGKLSTQKEGIPQVSHVIASESCALDLMAAETIREVEPGEILHLKGASFTSSRIVETPKTKSFCSFEPIYFSRPDSKIFNHRVYAMRRDLGVFLASEDKAFLAGPQRPDVVIAVPDSGVPMAIGYASTAGLPYELGLVRNHYVGRTFIEPTQGVRDFGVRLKLNAVPSVLEGKSVVVVDDSVVRGTTSRKIIRMLRAAGAREIHMRIGSPPITHSCYFGVDTPKRKHLLAAQSTVEEIRDILGCDSIAFLSLEGLKHQLEGKGAPSYCFACFSGRYPAPIHQPVEPQRTDAVKSLGI